MPTLLSSTSMRPKALRHAATIASTSAARETSAVKAIALPPSEAMILAVCSAAAPLRSTQNTCALAREGHGGRLAVAPTRPDRAGADHERSLSLEPLHRLLPFSACHCPQARIF